MAGTKQKMILNLFSVILARDKVCKVKADTTPDVESDADITSDAVFAKLTCFEAR